MRAHCLHLFPLSIQWHYVGGLKSTIVGILTNSINLFVCFFVSENWSTSIPLDILHYYSYYFWLCLCAQSYPTVCNPMDGSPPGSSLHGISQARILEWVAMPSSGGIFLTRGLNCVSYIDRWIVSPLSYLGSPSISPTLYKYMPFPPRPWSSPN